MTATTTTGYARAERAPSVGTQLRRSRLLLALAGLFVVIVVIIYVTGSEENSTPLSTHNPGPVGAMAVAEVARAQGLDLREIDSLSRARISQPATTTLVIADGGYLQSFQAQSVVDYPGDIVVIGWGDAIASALGMDLSSVYGDSEVVYAGCTDADASAAGAITSDGQRLSGELTSGATACFESPAGGYGYVVIPHGNFTVTLIADASIAINDEVANEGNAALVLRAIGKHEHAVWYVGSFYDSSTLTWTQPSDGGTSGPGGPGGPGSSPVGGSPDFLPPGTGNALYGLGVALIAVALWRARRFGALVTEPLPVVIRASEATRGRARMYRAARAYGRSGASLRAAAATRIGRRLGVSRYEGKDALLVSTARATGRNIRDLENLLYGPAPTDESAMIDLALALDQLESEVHRL